MISKYLKTLSSSITKKVLIIQSCPTLCDLRTIYSSPGSSIHGILLARILEWAAFPSSQASLVAQLVKNLPAGDLDLDPWVGKIPWRRAWLPTPVFWPGEFHGLYSPWVCKESDTTEQLSLSLFPSSGEKSRKLDSCIEAYSYHLSHQGMATHSSFLPGESRGQRAWQARVHGVAEFDTTKAT